MKKTSAPKGSQRHPSFHFTQAELLLLLVVVVVLMLIVSNPMGMLTPLVGHAILGVSTH